MIPKVGIVGIIAEKTVLATWQAPVSTRLAGLPPHKTVAESSMTTDVCGFVAT